MWFITTVHQKPKFYRPDGKIVNHEDVAIEWTTEHIFKNKDNELTIGGNSFFIVNAQQAISALYKAGIEGFPNKEKAKVFARNLPHGSFKYLRIIDRNFDTESRRIARELKR